MINHNYRSMVDRFMPHQQATNKPRVTLLTRDRLAEKFISIDAVPGKSNSSIEKMTHPLAECSEPREMSPYMMYLLGNQRAFNFAEKVLQAPRKRLLDQLGIDDSNKIDHHTHKYAKLDIITRFYSQDVQFQPKKIELNGQAFIEQEPTKPYFHGQKVITPDFTLYRSDQKQQKNNLLLCRTRDDSALYFNQAPIVELKRYNDDIFTKESALRTDDGFLNKIQYFIPMVEYLTAFGQAGDILVQNSLETSSDRNTPHLQFVPGNIPLPLFYRNSQSFTDGQYQQVDWYLPTLSIVINSTQADWKKRIDQVQTVCQALLTNQHISTTPVFRYLGDNQIRMYLIFKKDGSGMAPELCRLAPGWLESCGIFIANTPKATTFTTQGAQQYYALYGATDRDRDKLLTALAQSLD